MNGWGLALCGWAAVNTAWPKNVVFFWACFGMGIKQPGWWQRWDSYESAYDQHTERYQELLYANTCTMHICATLRKSDHIQACFAPGLSGLSVSHVEVHKRLPEEGPHFTRKTHKNTVTREFNKNTFHSNYILFFALQPNKTGVSTSDCWNTEQLQFVVQLNQTFLIFVVEKQNDHQASSLLLVKFIDILLLLQQLFLHLHTHTHIRAHTNPHTHARTMHIPHSHTKPQSQRC